VLAHTETRFDSSSIRRVVRGRRWSGFSTQPGEGTCPMGVGVWLVPASPRNVIRLSRSIVPSGPVPVHYG
jgi:hypothetical protein